MGRPGDWSPLAGSDPVPGDPAGISAEAAHLSRVAEQIAGQVGMLRKIAAGQSAERGQHVAPLEKAASDTANQLDQVTGRYQRTASALTGWVPELEYAQGLSLKALAQAQDAASRQQANQAVIRATGAKLTPAEHQADQARQHRLQQASDDLAAAHTMLNSAISHRDQKAAETSRKINDAASQGSDSAWDDFKHWVDQHAKAIESVANIAGWVATICGILSMAVGWIPVVGQIAAGILDTIATLATLVSLGCHLMLACAGDGSWAEVGLDAFALITLGMGRVFAKAAEGGYTAARAASLAKVAGGVNSGERTLAGAKVAEKLIDFSPRGARTILQNAKGSLELPGWGKAVLKGLNPVQLAKDTAGEATGAVRGFGAAGKALSHVSLGDFASGAKSLLHNPGGTLRFGDAAAGQAAHAFGKVSGAMPDITRGAGVGHWTDLAHSSELRFYKTVGAGVGVDFFNKMADAKPDWPVMHQFEDFKGWAKHEV